MRQEIALAAREIPKDRTAARRVVLAAVILAFGISTLGISGVPVVANPLRAQGMTLTADFPRTVGLYPHSRVLVQGIKAGSISKVTPMIDRVRVTMQVHDVALASDASATMRLRSLIGERYISLSPVWSGKGPRMQDHAHIPMDRTHVPAEVSEFLDEATRVSEQLDKQALGKVVNEMAQAIGNDPSTLSGTTSALSDLGQALSARAGDLDTSIAQLQQVMGTLSDHNDQLVRILRSSTAISQALLTQQGALDGAVTGMDRLLGTLTDFTGKEKGKLADTIHLLSGTGELLTKHQADWQKIIDIMPYYAYGWNNVIHHDGNHWFLMEQIAGIMFLPYPHQMNESSTAGWGPGNQEDDHSVYPEVDWSCSPLRAVVPWQVDATKVTGPGPLLPSQNIGNGFIVVDNRPGQAYHAPGYQGGDPQTAPPPDPSGCNSRAPRVP